MPVPNASAMAAHLGYAGDDARQFVYRQLHACLPRAAGFFGLHHQQDVGLVEQRIVSAQHGRGVALGGLAAHHHTRPARSGYWA